LIVVPKMLIAVCLACPLRATLVFSKSFKIEAKYYD
jgi:hypothetical protein